MGDQIIQHYVTEELRRTLPNAFFSRLPTQDYLAYDSLKKIENSKIVIVAGTNLLTSQMNKYRQWKIRLIDLLFIKKKVVLMGVGWWQYQESPNFYTKAILKNVLSSERAHSVRDNYTKKMLSDAGIRNVLNTGCPTLWGMNEERCGKIPQKKADTVIVTLTDYKRDPKRDKGMLEMLARNYENLAIWPQGSRDREYLESLGGAGKPMTIVGSTLEAFTDFLTKKVELDYVGTRLHAGIHAMNLSRRTIIVAVDNRATEKQADMNLPVIGRDDIDGLERAVLGEFKTEIRVPWENIEKWREQFLA
jgi:polysaccharide pyruvyl transferase WcaK-like protein